MRLAVALLWDRSLTVCELTSDGRPSVALALAAGVRWRAVWTPDASYAVGDGVAHEGAAWRAVGVPAGAPGVDAGWTPSGEADLLDLVGRSLTAENGGAPVTVRALERTPSMRARGVRGSAGAAGSLPR